MRPSLAVGEASDRGGRGIRTRERVAPLHALQACPFVRSGRPPERFYGRQRASPKGSPFFRGGGVIRTREGRIGPLTAFEAVPFVRSGTPPPPSLATGSAALREELLQ